MCIKTIEGKLKETSTKYRLVCRVQRLRRAASNRVIFFHAEVLNFQIRIPIANTTYGFTLSLQVAVPMDKKRATSFKPTKLSHFINPSRFWMFDLELTDLIQELRKKETNDFAFYENSRNLAGCKPKPGDVSLPHFCEKR